MPTSGRALRIRTHLVLLIMAALVPVILFSAAMLFMHARQERAAMSRLMESMAEEVAQRVDSHLQQTVAGLRALGQSDALSGRDLRAFHALAGRLVKAQQWSNLQLLGPEGEHLLNTRVPYGAALPPLNRPDFAVRAAASRQPLVSGMIQEVVSKQFFTVVYVPVVHQQEPVKYVIAVAIEPGRWQKLVTDQMGGEGGMQAMLLDRQSRIITSTYQDGPDPMADGIRKVSFDMPAGERASRSAQVSTIYGHPAYVFSRKTDLPGWTVATFVPVEAFDAPVRRSMVGLAGGFLLLLLSGVSLALLLGRRTANSISRLVLSVRTVAAGGAPLPMRTQIAEVTQASQALTETAALLAARLRSEEIAHAKLEAADQAKNAFLALLGHELRNPLAPIRNAVDLMKQTPPGSKAALWATGVIDRQSSHLARLVDDLLDVTRIDHGKIELRKEIVDLRLLLQSALQDHRGVLEHAGVTLTLDEPSAAVLVDCDRIRVAQIIGNLLHNAAKFTPRGGRVGIRLAQEGAMAVVEVSDNGEGISPDHLETIFELFVQAHPSGVAGNTGLGIGLALARKLVALHGGAISAASAGPGQGSTFRVELPAVGAAAGAIPETKGPLTEGAGARVLIVDDNHDAADMLNEMLSMSGFRSAVAYGGQAALEAVEHELPDAVLLDIGLPDIDGYEVCRRIRSAPMQRQPALIAVTGWGQDQDCKMATAAGFDAHLTKPADADRIVELLKELVNASSVGGNLAGRSDAASVSRRRESGECQSELV